METLKEETEIWVVYIRGEEIETTSIAHFHSEKAAREWIEMIPPFCAHADFYIKQAIVANKTFMPEEGWT